MGEEGATSLAKNGTYNAKNVTEASSVNYGVLGSSDFAAADGTLWSNYSLSGSALTGAGSITAKALTATAASTSRTYDGSTAVQLAAGGITLNGFVGEEGATSLAKNGTYNSKNVSEATSVNYGVLATGDFAAANGTQWSNYALPGTALTGAGSITPRALTVSLQGTVEKMVDGNTKATLAPANYAITNVVSGESISIEQPAGQFDTAIPGAGKLIAVVLSNSDYRAGSNTLLANYQLRTGDLSGNVGKISQNNVDANNEGQLSGNVGTISLPQAFNGVLTALPSSGTSSDQGTAVITVSNAGRTEVVTSTGSVTSPLAPASPSVVSGNTRENLLSRRAFSIGDGGIRLPQGVRGSDKDASQ